MTRLQGFTTAATIGLLTVGHAQNARQPPAPGSDYFTGNWMLNPAKTINWTGRDNTSFEFSMLKVENDVQERDVETGYGVAGPDGVQQHNRRRNSVKIQRVRSGQGQRDERQRVRQQRAADDAGEDR